MIREVDFIPYRRKPKAPAYITEAIIPCKFYFIVERRIVSRTLPFRAGLTLDAFKKYLLLCRREQFGHGFSVSGYEDSSKYVGIAMARKKEDHIVQELIDKHFIEVVDTQKHKYRVRVTPLHDGTNFIENLDKSRVWQHLKDDGNGFIRMPREIVDLGYVARLSGRQIQVLLQLYLYNELSIYGGVDPNVIHFPVRCKIKGFKDISVIGEIDESLYTDLYLTREDFIVTLTTLLQIGLIKPVKVVVVTDDTRIHYVSDFTDGRELEQGERVIQMLRPVYQIVGEVKDWNDCNR